jgi:hypothetical protein
MLGGAAIVAGTVLLTLNGGSREGGFKMRLAVLMLGSALMLALSTAIFKLFAVRDEFWTTTGWTGVGQALFGLLLLMRPSTCRQLRAMLHGNAGGVLTLNAANEGINLAGSLAQRYARLLAPLSLVQAVGGTAPLFVFLFGIGLSMVYPSLGKEDLSPSSLVRKAVAAVLVAAGVSLVGGS